MCLLGTHRRTLLPGTLVCIFGAVRAGRTSCAAHDHQRIRKRPSDPRSCKREGRRWRIHLHDHAQSRFDFEPLRDVPQYSAAQPQRRSVFLRRRFLLSSMLFPLMRTAKHFTRSPTRLAWIFFRLDNFNQHGKLRRRRDPFNQHGVVSCTLKKKIPPGVRSNGISSSSSSFRSRTNISIISPISERTKRATPSISRRVCSRKYSTTTH